MVENQEVVEEFEEVEVEAEEEVALGQTSSPRERHPKRPITPPLPVNLLSRAAREQIELAKELRASGYPDTRVDSAGAWVRVAGPLVATAADTPAPRPLVVPRTEAQQVGDVDPHELDNAASSRRVVLATHNFTHCKFC